MLELQPVTNDLLAAVYTRLSNAGLGCSVYDHVPDGTDYPYVAIGDPSEVEYGTKNTTGSDSTLVIHINSQYRGRKEVATIGQDIIHSLTRSNLSISNYQVVTTDLEMFQIFMDADGITRHGVIRFRWHVVHTGG